MLAHSLEEVSNTILCLKGQENHAFQFWRAGYVFDELNNFTLGLKPKLTWKVPKAINFIKHYDKCECKSIKM